MTLRSEILKLAHAKPELRPHLMPLLKKQAAVEIRDRGTSSLRISIRHQVPFMYANQVSRQAKAFLLQVSNALATVPDLAPVQAKVGDILVEGNRSGLLFSLSLEVAILGGLVRAVTDQAYAALKKAGIKP